MEKVIKAVDAEHHTTFHSNSNELVLGFVRHISPGRIKVEFYLNGQRYIKDALSTGQINSDQLNRQVVISFINGDCSTPIVLGLVHSALYEILENVELQHDGGSKSVIAKETPGATTPPDMSPITVDGQKVVLEASEQLQLRCGDSSITLYKDGKIQIRGKYILSRASGVNRITGGSVQVN